MIIVTCLLILLHHGAGEIGLLGAGIAGEQKIEAREMFPRQIHDRTELEWLDLSFSNATSADLKSIGKLKALERLSLEGTAVDDQLLDAVRVLPRLAELDLTGCAIDDAGLKKLAKHPQLTTLWLGKTHVTDDALNTIAAMTRLKFVDIQDSKITAAAWSEFVKHNSKFAATR